MQTDAQTPDPVLDAIKTLNDLDPESRQHVLVALLSAIHEHDKTGDTSVLEAMSRDIAFTLRMRRSDLYRKLVENTPPTSGRPANPVSGVLAELGL